MTLNILYLLARLPYPPNDGGAKLMYESITHLHKRGHRLHIVALNTLKHQADPAVFSAFGKIYTTTINSNPTVQGAILGLFDKLPYSYSRFYTLKHAQLIQQVLKNNSIDLVYLEGAQTAIYIDDIRQVDTKVPIILRAHNVEYDIWATLAKNNKNWIKKAYYIYLAKRGKTFEKAILSKVNGIIAITENDANGFKTLGFKGQMTVIPAGIEPYMSFEHQPQKDAICFIGSLEWQPNVQGLLFFLENAWHKVLEKVPTAELHIAGKNPPPTLQFNYKNVVFHGMVKNAQAFLSKFDMTIVPLWAGSGIRIKILESLSLGLCVVTTPLGIQGIPTQNNVHACIANTPQTLAEVIIQLLKDDNKRKKIAATGKQWAIEQYSWDGLMNKTEQFFSSVMKN